MRVCKNCSESRTIRRCSNCSIDGSDETSTQQIVESLIFGKRTTWNSQKVHEDQTGQWPNRDIFTEFGQINRVEPDFGAIEGSSYVQLERSGGISLEQRLHLPSQDLGLSVVPISSRALHDGGPSDRVTQIRINPVVPDGSEISRGSSVDFKYCGPDVTEELIQAMIVIFLAMPRIPRTPKGLKAIAKRAAILASLTGPGSRLDRIKDKGKTAPGKNCPQYCRWSLEIYGRCLDFTVPGNIAFGILGGLAGLSSNVLHLGSGIVNALGGSGKRDSDEDSASIDAGFNLANKFRTYFGMAHSDAMRALGLLSNGLPPLNATLSRDGSNWNSIPVQKGKLSKAFLKLEKGFGAVLSMAIEDLIEQKKIKIVPCDSCPGG